jgi:hypothetical protein
MPVHIGEIVSNVVPEPEPSPQSAGSEPEWRRAAQLREMHARSCRDHWRTAAEGFDD